MKALLLTLWVLGANTASPDASVVEPLGVEQRLSAPQVHLGEPFELEVKIRHALDERYELTTQPSMAEFEVLSLQRERTDGPNEALTTFRVSMSAFDLGKRTLPERQFEVTSPRGRETFLAPSLTIEVLPALDGGADAGLTLRDYKPPEEVRIPSWALVWWALGLLLVGLALLLLVRFLKSRRARPTSAPLALPLETRTLQALEALRAERLPQQGRVREFYFRLSELLRGYLGERYRFEALECTSAELIERTAKLTDPPLPKEGLTDFVHRSDFIKFARGEASSDACEGDLAFVIGLVRATTPPPVMHER